MQLFRTYKTRRAYSHVQGMQLYIRRSIFGGGIDAFASVRARKIVSDHVPFIGLLFKTTVPTILIDLLLLISTTD
jgi:hypothetical protein